MLKTKLFVFDSTLALCLCSAWGCLSSSHIWEPSSSWQQTSKCLPEGTRGLRELLGRQPQYPSSELKGGASICYEKVCEEELPPQCTETINLKNNLPWKGGQVRYPLISFNDAYWAPTTARMAGPQSTGRAQVLGGKNHKNKWMIKRISASAGQWQGWWDLSVIDLLKIPRANPCPNACARW